MNKVKSIIISMLVFATALSVAGTVNAQDNWTMFRHDLDHTGYSTDTAPITNRLHWEYPTGDDVYSSPAAVDGYVYVGSNDGKVYCFDADDGTPMWINETTVGYAVKSSPAVANGYVYVGSDDYKVYCFYANSGDLKWSNNTGNPVGSSPAVADGRVYVGSGNGKVYCFDANDGTRIWQKKLGIGIAIYSSPAVANGYIYIGSQDGYIYCLDPSGPTILWRKDIGGGIGRIPTPAVVDGFVYIGSHNHKIYCLDASNGDEIWNYTTGGEVGSSPAVAYGNIYIGSDDDNVYCLDADDGGFIWSSPTGGDVTSSPASADDKIYVGSNDGKVYCFDATTGDEIWNKDTFEAVESSPAVYEGMVFVGSDSNKVYAFKDSNPPNAPEKPDGPSSGEIGVEYTFTTNATDPDGEEIQYGWDWDGDDAVDEWTDFYPSGDEIETSHSWDEAGTYDIKVKAKDESGLESDWSPIHTIEIGEAVIKIENISGGLGVSAVIKNTGGADATNVKWSIKITGGIFGFINKEATGTFSNLAAGAEEEISSGMFFGIGGIDIIVTAEDAEGSGDIKTAEGLVILVFVIIQ